LLQKHDPIPLSEIQAIAGTYETVSQEDIEADNEYYAEHYGLGCIQDNNDDELNRHSDSELPHTRDDSWMLEIYHDIDWSSSHRFPPIGNQGQYGSCVSWASTYYQYSFEVNRMNNTNATQNNSYSPSWMFDMINGGQNVGSNLSTAFGVLEKHGSLKWSTEPYTTPHIFDWSNDTSALIEALSTRLVNYGVKYINTTSDKIESPSDSQLDEIKLLLLSDKKVLTIEAYACDGLGNWTFKQISSVGNSGNVGDYAACYAQKIADYDNGHAMTIVGFDDNITCDINGDNQIQDNEKGAFKVVNSWGDNWKNDGCVWVMYDALNKSSADTSFSVPNRISIFDRNSGANNKFYSIDVENKDVNLVGLLDVNMSKRYNLEVNVKRSDYYSYQSVYSSSSSDYGSFNGTLVFDYLDFDDIINPNTSYNWMLNLTNLNSANITGNLTYKIVDNKQNNISSTYSILNNANQKTLSISKSFKKGDLNYDGHLTNADVVIIQEKDAGIRILSDLQNSLGDMNNDGVVDLVDAFLISQNYD